MDKIEIALEKAINEPSLRENFYETLMDSKVFIILNEVSQQQHIKEEGINIATWVGKGNVEVVPFFSNEENLKQVIKSQPAYMQLRGKDLFKMINGSAAVLNPYTKSHKEFPIEEISLINNLKK